ncbi:MAG: OmpA family protein [Flavobacteriaceae bacterium]|nr:OmpA family protein [Flavobacteriaceae bacterium]
MFGRFYYIFFFVFSTSLCFAQDVLTHTVYFDTDKYILIPAEERRLLIFLDEVQQYEAHKISVLGYCDDRGSENYNLILSENRVNSIKKYLLSKDVIKNIETQIKGLGEIPLKKKRNIELERAANRRVDIEFHLNDPELVKENKDAQNITRSGRMLPKDDPKLADTEEPFKSLLEPRIQINDVIILKNVHFQSGRSTLVSDSHDVLDKIANILVRRKDIHFEVRGHVCCIPNSYDDAFDRNTRRKNLSSERARIVYRYLLAKGVEKNRMTYKGYGRRYPLKKGDKFDRRVDIKITRIQ